MSKPSLRIGRPSAGSTAKTLASLSDSTPTTRVHFELDRDRYRKLKILAANRGESLRSLLTGAVDGLIVGIE